jgi:hypothetical protein
MNTAQTTRQTHDAYHEATGKYPRTSGQTHSYVWATFGKDRTCAGCGGAVEDGATSIHPRRTLPRKFMPGPGTWDYESELKRALTAPGYHPRCLPVNELDYFTSTPPRKPSVTVQHFERAVKAPRFRLTVRPGMYDRWGGLGSYSEKVRNWLLRYAAEQEEAAA